MRNIHLYTKKKKQKKNEHTQYNDIYVSAFSFIGCFNFNFIDQRTSIRTIKKQQSTQ